MPTSDDGMQSLGPEQVADAEPSPEGAKKPTAVDCSALTPTPASFELLEGFTSSEDFVFDESGNYVGIDDDNNLVRVSRDRKRTLWVPKIGSVAGMGMLPDGSVVFCEVEKGALHRVYPNGAVAVVLGGLLYPNGLDIGPDGFVYVAENNGGRVRRVNPDTGEFTIVAMGLEGPNGVAFSPDPGVLYVGSFEGSGVYQVEVSEPGELGKARVFARPPGSTLRAPVNACPDQLEGAECSSPYHTASRCQALANVIDCLPVDPCPDLDDGEICDYPAFGTCRNHTCDPIPSCEELGEGAACEELWSRARGTCRISDGYAYCEIPGPCDALEPGASCEDSFSGPGTCVTIDGGEGGEDYTYCEPPNPCDGLAEGARCESPLSGPGTCLTVEGEEGSEGYTYCESVNPCQELEEGAACEAFPPAPGTCRIIAGGEPSEDFSYCEPLGPCSGLALGSACRDASSSEPGICQRVDGYTFCGPPGPCETLAEGAVCEDIYSGPGVCRVSDGYRYCGPRNSCEGLKPGAPCEDVPGSAGACADSDGASYCAPLNVCLERREGAPCQDPFWTAGTCHDDTCVPYEPTSGGIDGLGVDACGNVYASEYIYGKVWRISPRGEIELLAELPSAWIPNIKWGRDVGGFSSDVMYVADRDRQRLFGIYVGVPGVTEFFAMGREL